MAQRTYHTLLTRDLKHLVSNRWCIAFGDYDRNVVKAEQDEYRSQGYAAADLRIIETAPDRRSVDTAVAALNAADDAKVARK